MLIPASLGAAAAGVLVILLGLEIHKALSRVLENMLNFALGILLSAFGVFWVGGKDRAFYGLEKTRLFSVLWLASDQTAEFEEANLGARPAAKPGTFMIVVIGRR